MPTRQLTYAYPPCRAGFGVVGAIADSSEATKLRAAEASHYSGQRQQDRARHILTGASANASTTNANATYAATDLANGEADEDTPLHEALRLVLATPAWADAPPPSLAPADRRRMYVFATHLKPLPSHRAAAVPHRPTPTPCSLTHPRDHHNAKTEQPHDGVQVPPALDPTVAQECVDVGGAATGACDGGLRSMDN